MQTKPHSVFLAILLSIVPGAGQAYNRQYVKGLLIAPTSALLFIVVKKLLFRHDILLVSAAQAMQVLFISMIVFIMGTMTFAAIDAGMIASRIKRGEAVALGKWF